MKILTEIKRGDKPTFIEFIEYFILDQRFLELVEFSGHLAASSFNL